MNRRPAVQPAVRLSGVTYTYPEATAPSLDGIDLTVAEGEFLLIAGPSGSGKSTLLRTINGLVPHYSGGRFAGRVEILRTDITGRRPRDVADLVGFVAQDPHAHQTADRTFEEVSFAAENLGIQPPRLRAVVEEAIDQLGLGGLRNRRLDTLSGGERQRVAIAAVLAAQPKVLVCDEPTSSLDPQSAEEVLSALVRLRDDLGLTILCAEHRLERVAAFADRVAYIDGPGGVTTGPPRDVFASIPVVPPVSRLGRELGWDPLPVTVREGRAFARTLELRPPHGTNGTQNPAVSGRPAPVLEAREVSVRHGPTAVLDRASLSLHPGDLTAVVGRNGAGKTTLLRTLVGLQAPAQGSVTVAGRAVRKVEDAAPHVAYLPQRPDVLLFRDTAGAEIAAAARGRQAAARWAERLRLPAGLLHRHPWHLSAGQRLAVALAVTLARPTQVVLLDEPTRGLDPRAKDDLAELLHEEAAAGRAVLLVTHDVELVARAASRVALLAEGHVVAEGAVRDVLGSSVLFSSQTAKVMDDPRFLVPEDVLAVVR